MYKRNKVRIKKAGKYGQKYKENEGWKTVRKEESQL